MAYKCPGLSMEDCLGHSHIQGVEGMRRRREGCSIYESYPVYGLARERAEALLKECRAGKHRELVQKAAGQAEPHIAKWIIPSIVEGKSLHDMEIKWELGEAEIMPCGRNSFYAYRKLTLAILDRMLSGMGTEHDGQL